MAEQGIEVNSPRNCFREAALNNLISDPLAWFNFMAAQQKVLHTYDESNINFIVDTFELFSNALQELITNLEKIK